MASAEPAKPPEVGFEVATPILRVENLATSLDYYTRVLGFKIPWQDREVACVVRGKVSIFLCQGDQGHSGGWVWVGVEDTDALREEYRRTGARVRHEPANYPWAYEMQVQDPDGNVLRIGSEPKRDLPRGEWLDMDGDLWAPMPDGSWRRAG